MITVCIYCVPTKDYETITSPTDLLEGLIADLLYLHHKLKSSKLHSSGKIKVCPHIHIEVWFFFLVAGFHHTLLYTPDT